MTLKCDWCCEKETGKEEEQNTEFYQVCPRCYDELVEHYYMYKDLCK
jgi:hypothetical protein